MSEAVFIGLVLVAATSVGIWLAPIPGVYVANPWLWHLHTTYFQRSQLSLLIALIPPLGAVAAVVIAISKSRGIGDPLSSIGWNLNRQVGISALAGLGFSAVVSVACALIFGGIAPFMDGFAPASILLYFITTVLAQPFVEECYFRGILFTAAYRSIGRFGSVALTAVLFGLFHIGNYRLILVYVTLGIILAITRIRTRSVAACFALHAAYNFGVLVSRLVQAR
jgi:membrane protease YdiL (CAAX protease family)